MFPAPAPSLHTGPVFIRKVATRHRSSGGSYSSFRLVRNVRSDSGTRQIHLLNLGADFDVPPQRWPELVQLILDCDSSQLPLKPPDPPLLALAQRIHRCLLERSALHPGDDLATVHLDSLDHSHVRSVGAERLALHALDQLAFRDALEAAGTAPRDARVATALVLARMLQPSSERAACDWLNSRSATLELLGLECARPLSLNKLYRTADLLWRHRDALEDALCRRERALFETNSTLVFIDLTNVHYHGRAGGDLQFGRSKQRRNDCPLVTLGLSLDESGFPLRSEVLPGNISEPGTLAAALQKLRVPRLRGQAKAPLPTVIMDAGLSTEENIAWLRAHGYDWITVQRGRKGPPPRPADVVFRTRQGREAQAWKLRREDRDAGAGEEEEPDRDASAEEKPGDGESAEEKPGEDEARLCVWSHRRQAKDDAILERQRKSFEEAVRDLHAGLSVKGRTKRYEKVLERLGRIKERHSKVARQYEIAVRPGQKKKGKQRLAAAVTLRRSQQHAERTAQAGCYVLRTSHAAWDTQRIVQTYWQLADIEATFRSLKSEAGLRPVYHRKPERVRGHLFIAVLAYHAIHLLRRRLKARGIHASWTTIRRRLSRWMRQTTRLQAEDGSWIETRQDTRPGAEAAAIAEALGQPARLHRRRVRIPAREVGQASGPLFGDPPSAGEKNPVVT